MCLSLLRRRMARGGGAGGMFSPRFTKKSRFGNSVRCKKLIIGSFFHEEDYNSRHLPLSLLQ